MGKADDKLRIKRENLRNNFEQNRFRFFTKTQKILMRDLKLLSKI